jgi:thioredoxin 1
MATIKVDTKNFKSEVLDSNVPVVVDFWAEWCGPCKMIGPSLEEIADEMAGSVKIVKVNIDENPELGAQYGVRSIPTLLMFKGGERGDVKTSAAPKSVLASWIKAAAA